MNGVDRRLAPSGLEAVVEIGSTGLRLLVAELDGAGGFRIVDRAGKPARLGRDVFTRGSLSRASMVEAIAILRGFRELLAGYGLRPEDARVIATSALREATNRETFVDRVALRTGFSIQVVEDIEENHLMYLAVQRALGDEWKARSRGSNALIIEVGGGSTELMLLRRGKMAAAHSIRIGTIRVDEQVRATTGSAAWLGRFLEDHVRTTCDMLEADMALDTVRTFVAIGGDARFAARTLASLGPDAEEEGYAVIDRVTFSAFAEELASLRPEEIVNRFRLPFDEAEGIGPGLLVLKLFLDRTAADELVVPSASIREGLLVRVALGNAADSDDEIRRQVLASSASLGRRFRYDEEHALHVADLALRLFDELKEEHGLGSRERLLLEAAAILHDVGAFIRSSGHHRHSEYIIQNSEIFGLQRDDAAIVASCARYHRKQGPSNAHATFMGLSREDRMAVLKLSALLRVADALDRGHTQRVGIASIELREDACVIRAEGALELGLERLSLEEKGDLFEDVFGLRAVLA